jgi:hypothetical protein
VTTGRLTLADVETALVGYLAGSKVHGTNRVSTELPRDFEARLPYSTLKRAPGSIYVDEDTGRLEAVRLQLDTYAGDPTAAFAATRELVAVLADADLETLDGVVVTSVRVTQAPQWAPDPDTDLARYLTYVVVHAHATTVGS